MDSRAMTIHNDRNMVNAWKLHATCVWDELRRSNRCWNGFSETNSIYGRGQCVCRKSTWNGAVRSLHNPSGNETISHCSMVVFHVYSTVNTTTIWCNYVFTWYGEHKFITHWLNQTDRKRYTARVANGKCLSYCLLLCWILLFSGMIVCMGVCMFTQQIFPTKSRWK